MRTEVSVAFEYSSLISVVELSVDDSSKKSEAVVIFGSVLGSVLGSEVGYAVVATVSEISVTCGVICVTAIV